MYEWVRVKQTLWVSEDVIASRARCACLMRVPSAHTSLTSRVAGLIIPCKTLNDERRLITTYSNSASTKESIKLSISPLKNIIEEKRTLHFT